MFVCLFVCLLVCWERNARTPCSSTRTPGRRPPAFCSCRCGGKRELGHRFSRLHSRARDSTPRCCAASLSEPLHSTHLLQSPSKPILLSTRSSHPTSSTRGSLQPHCSGGLLDTSQCAGDCSVAGPAVLPTCYTPAPRHSPHRNGDERFYSHCPRCALGTSQKEVGRQVVGNPVKQAGAAASGAAQLPGRVPLLWHFSTFSKFQTTVEEMRRPVHRAHGNEKREFFPSRGGKSVRRLRKWPTGRMFRWEERQLGMPGQQLGAPRGSRTSGLR